MDSYNPRIRRVSVGAVDNVIGVTRGGWIFRPDDCRGGRMGRHLFLPTLSTAGQHLNLKELNSERRLPRGWKRSRFPFGGRDRIEGWFFVNGNGPSPAAESGVFSRRRSGRRMGPGGPTGLQNRVAGRKSRGWFDSIPSPPSPFISITPRDRRTSERGRQRLLSPARRVGRRRRVCGPGSAGRPAGTAGRSFPRTRRRAVP